MKPSMRNRTFRIIHSKNGRSGAGRAFDAFLVTLIVVNVAAVILETEETIGNAFPLLLSWLEYVSVAIFTVEYALRLWTCVEDPKFNQPLSGRARFALKPLLLVDLLAILPFYLPILVALDLRFLRAVRLLRIGRILKIGRYSEALHTMERVIRAKKEELLISVGVLLLILVLCSGIMYFFENDVQPESFSSIPKALWWGVATLTTVGYGDIYPITVWGRLFGGVVQILGIGLFALPAGIVAGGFSEELRARSKPKVCPHCGQQLNE